MVRESKRNLFILIGVLTLFITAVSLLLAKRLSKSTLAPVSRLSNALKNDDFDHAVIALANDFSEDEIGILARQLGQALERVRKSAEREYEFNRGVSHELRSPIQTAQSAAELLQAYTSKGDEKFKKPVSRLQRSVAEMNEIVEAFLWLASDRAMGAGENCSLSELQQSLNTLRSSFPDHEIIVNIPNVASLSFPLPKNVLSVVLRSLMRNAVVHGDVSPIMVDVGVESISVTNSINPNNEQNQGFGIGLSIVQRICERFDCELHSQPKKEFEHSCALIFL